MSAKRQASSDGQANQPPSNGVMPDLVDEELFREAFSNVSNYLQNINREIHLHVDDSMGMYAVSVVDRASGRTLRTIHPHEVVKISSHISSNINDPIKGLLLKNKA